MAAILFVRVQSDLPPTEIERRLIERKPNFREVPGLIQKMYGKDEISGAYCGIYFFEDQKALADFRDSELARTIPTAYEATEVRPEIYEMLFPLHLERGPISE